MNKRIVVAFIVSSITLASMAAAPLAEGKRSTSAHLTVKVSNPSDVARRDVPVVIDLKKHLGKKAANVLSAEVIPLTSSTKVTSLPSLTGGVGGGSSSLPSQTGGAGGGSSLPSQLDDLDGDLIPDELAFVADIPARSTASFRVEFSAVRQPSPYRPRTAAFMKVWDRKYRYPYINSIEYQGRNEPLATYDAIYGHGAQWESELVGFRVYMDHRQSIDIYGKPSPQLVLDRTNFYSTREDIAASRGCDILFAGPSVGAGSFRGYVGGEPTYVDSVEARGQRVVASGPVRAIVEVWDKNWFYNSKTLQMRQRYTIYAGHRDVQVDITLAGAAVDDELFCTGVQKLEMDNEGYMALASGLVGSWGRNIPDKAAEDLVEGVGLGVYVGPAYLSSKKEDAYNYLTILRPRDGRISYHLAICALMERGGFRDSKGWFAWLEQWRAELDAPCTIKVK